MVVRVLGSIPAAVKTLPTIWQTASSSSTIKACFSISILYQQILANSPERAVQSDKFFERAGASRIADSRVRIERAAGNCGAGCEDGAARRTANGAPGTVGGG